MVKQQNNTIEFTRLFEANAGRRTGEPSESQPIVMNIQSGSASSNTNAPGHLTISEQVFTDMEQAASRIAVRRQA